MAAFVDFDRRALTRLARRRNGLPPITGLVADTRLRRAVKSRFTTSGHPAEDPENPQIYNLFHRDERPDFLVQMLTTANHKSFPHVRHWSL